MTFGEAIAKVEKEYWEGAPNAVNNVTEIMLAIKAPGDVFTDNILNCCPGRRL
jgi:hypothetical protein